MLKRCIRPLVTLVLALVAMGVLSTPAPARDFTSADGSDLRAASSVKPRPVAHDGEPDQPLSPPPVHSTGDPAIGMSEDSGMDIVEAIRWIGMAWAYWLLGAPF